MCGIAGYWAEGDRYRAPEIALQILADMAQAIHHRGPDGQGAWQDPASGIALTQARLAILDLSEAGRQPMHSKSERYCLTFNGEIYNHETIRAELETLGVAPKWRGHSDTESLLAAIEHWGLKQALEKSKGMFALALWDRKDRTLSLARDRIGEKPLYYGYVGKALLFASELKALQKFPDFTPELNPDAISLYLDRSYVPQPISIFKGISKLTPGTIAVFNAASADADIKPYWSFSNITQTPRRAEADVSFAEASKTLENLLEEVVSSQMISDVPLGSFLSGGIDSSLITALMQKSSSDKINTYSIGFEDPRFDESVHARRVAAHLGTHHTEFTVTEKDALDLVPSVSALYDEPFADPSLLPTVLLSRMTRKNVTVALSGDGGDEVFGGYNRHIMGPGLWSKSRKIPKSARALLTKGVTKLQGVATRGGESGMSGRLARLGLPITALEKTTKFSRVISEARTFDDFYAKTISTWPGQYAMPQLGSDVTGTDGQAIHPSFSHLGISASHIMALDTLAYLPDDIMVKVDRAAMSASLETRAPFLDPDIIEFAWSLPEAYLTENKVGKRVLRDVLYRHVPRNIIDRPKQGFAIPLDRWLRNDLKDWAYSGIEGFKNDFCDMQMSQIIDSLWQDHQTGRANNGEAIWTITMLDSWKKSLKATSVSCQAANVLQNQ